MTNQERVSKHLQRPASVAFVKLYCWKAVQFVFQTFCLEHIKQLFI